MGSALLAVARAHLLDHFIDGGAHFCQGSPSFIRQKSQMTLWQTLFHECQGGKQENDLFLRLDYDGAIAQCSRI